MSVEKGSTVFLVVVLFILPARIRRVQDKRGSELFRLES